MGIIQKVFSHPDLYAQLIVQNPHLRRMVDLFERKFSELKGIVQEGKAEELRKRIQQEPAGIWTGGLIFITAERS
jgi:prephenate dehydrogenase